MQANEHTNAINQDDEGFYYEVTQEQLDAVDRMLDELDMDEQFDRVPAAFRIVDQHQYTHFHDGASPLTEKPPRSSGAAGYNQNHNQGQNELLGSDDDMEIQEQHNESDAEDDERAAFGYIPLDQDGFLQMNDDDDEEEGTPNHESRFHSHNRMDSDTKDVSIQEDENEEDDGDGYDGYLQRRNADGTVATIVPVIPSAVAIDTAELDPAGVEPISEDDLKTISQVMSSFSLPAPEWARSIPEDRWLPKIVQQAEAEASNRETNKPSNE